MLHLQLKQALSVCAILQIVSKKQKKLGALPANSKQSGKAGKSNKLSKITAGNKAAVVKKTDEPHKKENPVPKAGDEGKASKNPFSALAAKPKHPSVKVPLYIHLESPSIKLSSLTPGTYAS